MGENIVLFMQMSSGGVRSSGSRASSGLGHSGAPASDLGSGRWPVPGPLVEKTPWEGGTFLLGVVRVAGVATRGSPEVLFLIGVREGVRARVCTRVCVCL